MTTTTTAQTDRLKVLDGIQLSGSPNTDDATLLAHIRHAIRQGFPQARPEPVKGDRIVIVGSGPSLDATVDELRALVFEGVKLITLNGAYHWCLERNIRPSAQVVLDARRSTVRFLEPVVPRCRYFVASQCHPDVWAAIRQRPETYIWHAVSPESPERALLDNYYGKDRWLPVSGGTTVFSRTLSLLSLGGFLRFDVFGVDSCWLDGRHHAVEQPENAHDQDVRVTVGPSGYPELQRTFVCAYWHLKQLEDLLQILRINGALFTLRFHGDGLLAYAVESMARAGEIDVLRSEQVESASA